MICTIYILTPVAKWVYGKEWKEALEMYQHYRDATGTIKYLNYSKAYRQDSYYKKKNNELIRKAQKYAVKCYKKKREKCFSIYSNKYHIDNGTSENWQKAIGAHNVWLSAVVEKKKKMYIMYTDIHFRDKYNFNKGNKDIGSGAKDDDNGRFEELGWARSFETYGSVHIEVVWEKNIKKSKKKVYKGHDY